MMVNEGFWGCWQTSSPDSSDQDWMVAAFTERKDACIFAQAFAPPLAVRAHVLDEHMEHVERGEQFWAVQLLIKRGVWETESAWIDDADLLSQENFPPSALQTSLILRVWAGDQADAERRAARLLLTLTESEHD